MTTAMPIQRFDCQLYVPYRGHMAFRLPSESGPVRVSRLTPLDYDTLIDPAFRRLIAAFESLPQSLPIVQV